VRGREKLVEDRPIRPGVLEHLTDQDVLDAVADALTSLVEKSVASRL